MWKDMFSYFDIVRYFDDSDSASRLAGHPKVWFTLTTIHRVVRASCYTPRFVAYSVSHPGKRACAIRGAFNSPNDTRQLRSDTDDVDIVSTAFPSFPSISRRRDE